jgi:hypothetical protein
MTQKFHFDAMAQNQFLDVRPFVVFDILKVLIHPLIVFELVRGWFPLRKVRTTSDWIRTATNKDSSNFQITTTKYESKTVLPIGS